MRLSWGERERKFESWKSESEKSWEKKWGEEKSEWRSWERKQEKKLRVRKNEEKKWSQM